MRFLRWLWDYLISIPRSYMRAGPVPPTSSRPSPQSSGVRALVQSALCGRVVKLADIENVRPSEFQDAISILADTYRMEREAIIALIDEHGLAKAVDYLEAIDGP